ncbi:hypothetical protein [Chitinophaga parva]|uniref:hypothetical protein n=1 Tax=Chitinophaga parva TaxID=2169414 RepID=UPI0010571A00|nr:hypothetical protein [Chitinophaga parva]
MKKIVLLAAGALLCTGVFAAPVVTSFQAPQSKQAPAPHHKKHHHHHGKKKQHAPAAHKPA